MSTQPKPSNPLKAVRGTRDLLPPETALWNRIEQTARQVFSRYGFGEIRTPIFERPSSSPAAWAKKPDIVSKEMYSWEDRATRAEREGAEPDAAPGEHRRVVRAYIEHKLGETGDLQKLYYIGPQFRRGAAAAGTLSPSSGRSASRCWAGVERVGSRRCATPRCWRCWPRWLDELGEELAAGAEFGWVYGRPQALRRGLRACAGAGEGADVPRDTARAETNPLRVLDSKEPPTRRLSTHCEDRRLSG